MSGLDLAKVVSEREPYEWSETEWALGTGYGTLKAPKFHVVAYDFGVKRNILRMLASRGCKVTVVPAQTPAAAVLELKPDGIFLSNGPGDPEPCDYAIEATRELIDTGIPTFGICLGHQILALASGAKTFKMKVRPPRRQPPGERPRQRARQHHQPEPRLRGRCEDAAGQPAADARVAVRRHAAGPGAHRQAGVLLPGPPRGLARPARHCLPVRPLHGADGNPHGEEECPSAPTSNRS